MEALKAFLTKDNLTDLFNQFYNWFAGLLDKTFGRYTYEPLKVLLVNPYFWIIILVIIILCLIFRRR